MRSGSRARTSPISSSRTATAGRPSIASTQGPGLALTSWSGPIGVQPWETPVISGTSAVIRTPETPPSVGRPAICRSEPLAEVRPPTRNAPLPALSRATVWRRRGGGDRRGPRRSGQRHCRPTRRAAGRGRRQRGRPSNSRKLSRAGCDQRHDRRRRAGTHVSGPAGGTPAPPVPTQSRTPVASASGRRSVQGLGQCIAGVDEAELGVRRQLGKPWSTPGRRDASRRHAWPRGSGSRRMPPKPLLHLA